MEAKKQELIKIIKNAQTWFTFRNKKQEIKEGVLLSDTDYKCLRLKPLEYYGSKGFLSFEKDWEERCSRYSDPLGQCHVPSCAEIAEMANVVDNEE